MRKASDNTASNDNAMPRLTTFASLTAFLALVLTLAAAIFPAETFAQGGPPPAGIIYYGKATVGGEPAPDGHTIVGRVGDYESNPVIVSGGKYAALSVAADASLAGQTITFFLGDVQADETDTYQPHGIPVIKTGFDLTFSALSEPTPAPTPIPTNTPVQSQGKVDSDKLAKFAALMQHIRSEPTPSDVNPALIPLFDTLDNALSGIYITGFITPFTGETPDQVNARLQSISAEDRFIAVMVESYRLADNDTLLNLIHDLLARYYVETFIIGTDLAGAAVYLRGSELKGLVDDFDSTDYNIPAPSAILVPDRTPPSQSAVASDKLAKFAALMQHIRSEPTPSDVNPALIPLFDTLDNALSGIYITGFITPFTGETPDQVNARLQSISAEDRFIAVMVESYHLADNDTLLDLIHDLLARYYVETFIVGTDLAGAATYLNGNELKILVDSFDSTDYNIPAPTGGQTPAPTPTAAATPSTTPVATATPTIAQLVRNVQGGVVQIITITSSGSGFIIDADGRVVTNQHVVGGNRSVTVRMNNGTEYSAVMLGVDPVADLAVIDIVPQIGLTPVRLGDSSRVQVGEEVIAIGYPLGFQLGQSQTVTDGIISSRRPNFQGSGVEHFQTNAAVNPGNSGGPLFNRVGEVIGVNTSRRETTSDGRPVIGISFAVAINEVKSRLTTLKGSGSPQPVTTPTPIPTPATPVPTPAVVPSPPSLPLGWNRYRNGVYGFSVDTPPGWTVDEDTEEGDFAYLQSPDRKAVVALKAYDLPASYSLQALAEWRRDWLTNQARDKSWNVFSITSFVKKQESGKEFYELTYRWQSTTEFCVSRNVDRIYISSWYPDKPHGYRVSIGVCEHSLGRYPSAATNAIQNSFTEWMPYWNATHAFGLNVAPGWTLEEETETDDEAVFWTLDKAGIFQIFALEVGPSQTLEDFVNWRLEILSGLGDSWEVYEPKGTVGRGGVVGAREEYLISYTQQTESKYCISDREELLALSSFHPAHPYGFLVITGVCQHSTDLYNDERWEMIYGFRY